METRRLIGWAYVGRSGAGIHSPSFWVLVVAQVIFLVGGIGPNWILALLSVAVLAAGTILLWRPGESPILVFIFSYSWLQSSIAIYHANWLSIDVAEYAPFFSETRSATVLSLGGILTLALGMRLGAGPRRVNDVLGPRQIAMSQPVDRWFRLYALAWVGSFLALSYAWVVPGLSQPLLALAAMKWAFFYMLAFAYFLRGLRAGWLLPCAFLFELVTSIGGYFSDFKAVFFVTLSAAVASGVKFSPGKLISSTLLAVLLVILGIVWTAVKGDFRDFVSGGGGEQVMTVDYATRLSKLADLVGDLDRDSLANGADQFLRRISYVELFGVVLANVPSIEPHTEGAILWDAVVRPFTPRLLFPDKDVIDDSARTLRYTGGLVGAAESTSVSLGYVAETFIDFGEYGLFAALLGIGCFYGAIYRILVRWKSSRGLLGTSLATAALLNTAALENSFTKVFGGVVVSLLAAWAIAAFAMPRIAPWLIPERR